MSYLESTADDLNQKFQLEICMPNWGDIFYFLPYFLEVFELGYSPPLKGCLASVTGCATACSLGYIELTDGNQFSECDQMNRCFDKGLHQS